MAITQDYILKGGLKSSDEAANNRLAAMDKAAQSKAEQQAATGRTQMYNDAKLAQLIKGAGLKQDAIAQNQAAADAWAKSQGLKPGSYSVHASDTGFASDPRAPQSLADLLTPAQRAAEGEGGKKAAEFQGGGRASMESNIGQIQGVQNDLEGGKRDRYDRVVGGALENHPTLQAMFNPAEKARRDQVQNAMLGMLHDAGIPRPTQWDIQRVFGQVYDSASDDQTNIARVKSAVAKMAAQKAAREQEAQNLQTTGYVTPGLGGNPRQAPPRTQGAPAQAPQGGTGLEHLSDEQLQQMAKQLGL